MITKQTLQRYTREIGDLGIGEKLNAIVTLLVFLTAFLLIMSVQAVRLQNAFREDHAAASMAAINIERVNGLIYAIVMEARGIYMSTDQTKVKRYSELEQLEIDTARQRDGALGERDKLNDKYLETKWQLSAALNNMPQGLVMYDSKGKILMTHIGFRTMYELPAHIIQSETTLRDILVYRASKDLFTGNVDDFMMSSTGSPRVSHPSEIYLWPMDGSSGSPNSRWLEAGGFRPTRISPSSGGPNAFWSGPSNSWWRLLKTYPRVWPIRVCT